jgi:hypothetical protein
VNILSRYTNLGLVTLLLVSMPALATQDRPGLRPAPVNTVLVLAQNHDIGAKRAATVARNATGGRVLTVKRTRTKHTKGANGAYQVKVLLKGGRMRILKVDAGNGNLR